MSSDKEKMSTNNDNNAANEDGDVKEIFNENTAKSHVSVDSSHATTSQTINSSNKSNNQLNTSEEFDFSKTGAKPKSKVSQMSSSSSSHKQKSSKSSASSSVTGPKPDQMDIDDDENLFINDVDNVNRNNQFKVSKIQGSDKIDQLQMLDDFTEIAECPLCGKIVKKDLQKHFEQEHREYECPFCGLLYDCESTLKDHIDNVHQCEEEASNLPIKNFEVGNFDFKSLQNDSEAKKLASNDEQKIDDDVIVCGEVINKSFTCPICNLNIQDQTWLELHVESHFNTNNFEDDCSTNPFDKKTDNELGACSLQRTCSASSLTANVDENFEIDQVMTLAECDSVNVTYNSSGSDKSSVSEKENACSTVPDLSYAKDHQLAQIIERQEKEQLKYKLTIEQEVSPLKISDMDNNLDEQLAKDRMAAQMLERQELESLKYDEWNKTSAAYTNKTENGKSKFRRKYDENMTPEEELEWLKSQYGMNDSLDSLTKAQMNLDRALKNKKIDQKTYNEEIVTLKNDLENIFDNGKTRSVGVIGVLNNMSYSKWMSKRYLCTSCDHYATGILDGGYGCGYRNTQMLLSSIRNDPLLSDKLFNNNNLNMPSVAKLQKLIEKAWDLGFDRIGRDQFNGNLVNTVKWIGASDIAALFSSLRIKVELVDIHEPKASNELISSILFNFVKNYFEKSKGHVHPIYLQHQGHSRTIVGIEIGKNDSMNLLLFDPGTKSYQIDSFKDDTFKYMYIFRKGPNAFKHKQYQLLVVRGLIETDIEYENSKVLKSSRL